MKIVRLILPCALVLSVSFAHAADFSIQRWQGRKVIVLSGPIEAGDAQRFAQIVGKADVFPHRVPVLLLDSPGGSVRSALELSDEMDLRPVHTVVPNGASCASACASVVFVAGRYRTVEHFGRLGQHSCSAGGVADQRCNEVLARHAANHGVSAGSVAAFVTYTPPDDIQWFSREDADGWGLTKYPGEDLSGFEKSEPRVIKMITGHMPPAQISWRLDFLDGGYRAFLRPVSDAERELQLNLYCIEQFRGRLFLSVEVRGQASVIESAIEDAYLSIDKKTWIVEKVSIIEFDKDASEIIIEIPKLEIISLINKAKTIRIDLKLKKPYENISAYAPLWKSRKVLLFAANNCALSK